MKGYRLKDKRERNQKIMEYRQKGYTLRAIAGVFHISQTAVWKIVRRLELADQDILREDKVIK